MARLDDNFQLVTSTPLAPDPEQGANLGSDFRLYAGGETEKSLVSLNLKSATAENPDQAAQAKDLSDKFGLPYQYTKRNIDAIKQRTAYSDIDLDHIRTTNRPLWNILLDREKLALTHDDIPVLQKISESVQGLKDFAGYTAQRFNRGVSNTRAAELGVKRMLSVKGVGEPLTPEEESELAGIQKSSGVRSDLDSFTNPMTGGVLGSIAGTVPAFAEQIPIMGDILLEGVKGSAIGAAGGAAIGGLSALLFGQAGPQVATPEEVVTVPAATIAGALRGGKLGFKAGTVVGAFELEGGLAMNEFAAIPGVDANLAADAAIGVGAVNAWFEYISLSLLGRTFTPARKIIIDRFKKAMVTESGKAVVSQFAKSYLKAVAGEGVTEFLQEATTIFGGEVLKEFGTDQEGDALTVLENFFSGENVERMTESGLGGIQGAILMAAPGTALSIHTEKREAKRKSENEQLRIDDIAEAVKESKTAVRSKDTIREYMQSVLDGNNVDDTVYIPAAELVKMVDLDIKNKQGKTYDQIRDQLELAVENNADVVLSIADFAADVMTDEKTFTQLRDHIRLSTDTLTNAETKQIDEVNFEKIQRMTEDAVKNADMFTESKAVWDRVTEQLIASGQVPDVAKAQASIIPAWAATRAARSNGKMTVMDAYAELGVRVADSAEAKQTQAGGNTMQQMVKVKGVKVTGEQVEFDEPAGVALENINVRRTAAQELIKCLAGS